MRDSFEKLLKQTCVVECRLPCNQRNLDKSCLTSDEDLCLKSKPSEEIAKIIYNGIIEFAVNEFKINYNKIDTEQLKVMLHSIRYDYTSTNAAKLKYGFYGEVLLDLILRVIEQTNVLIARGYFYSPLENGEVKGFDAFHIMERNNETELWFGEAKFFKEYKSAISSVLDKINTSLSESYINKNLFAIIHQKENLSTHNGNFDKLIEDWENNPVVNLSSMLSSYNLKIVYPVLIVFQKDNNHTYDLNIKNCIEHITKEYKRLNIMIPEFLDCRIFFMFLPLSDVQKVKQQVIEWIDTREPLI
jgi:hypothetical protein